EELKDQIDDQMLDARKRLLESVDERVIDRLTGRKDEITSQLSDFDKQLLYVARAELPDARFHVGGGRRFDYRGDTDTAEWPSAGGRGWKVFRLMEGTRATEGVRKANER